MKRLLVLVLLCLSAHAWPSEVFPGERWNKIVSPDAVGWSADKLKSADVLASSLHTDAYLVVQDGAIVHQYGRIGDAMNLHSVRKSILSVLFGVHADRGSVHLGKSLAELDIDDKQTLSATERQATVQQLLQARSGIYHPAAYEPAGMKANRPARGSSGPGERWFYNNWDFNALGTIFTQFTGKTVFESLRDDLAKPLQFEDFSYTFDTKFHYERASKHPAYIIRLSARDLARVGLLMARDGRWKDDQIVAKAWVAESTASYSSVSIRTGYGYMWWVGTGDRFYAAQFPGKVYAAEGSRGQFMVVDPVRDLVIVHRVDSDADRSREVTDRQFVELLQRILEARLPAR